MVRGHDGLQNLIFFIRVNFRFRIIGDFDLNRFSILDTFLQKCNLKHLLQSKLEIDLVQSCFEEGLIAGADEVVLNEHEQRGQADVVPSISEKENIFMIIFQGVYLFIKRYYRSIFKNPPRPSLKSFPKSLR